MENESQTLNKGNFGRKLQDATQQMWLWKASRVIFGDGSPASGMSVSTQWSSLQFLDLKILSTLFWERGICPSSSLNKKAA